MRKIYLFLLTLLCAVGASAQTTITELSGISNDKSYTIKSQGRGYLYYDNTVTDKMRSTSHTNLSNDTPDGNVEANQIAILKTALTPENCYYLYSVAAQKFLSYDGRNVTLWLSDTPYLWELTKATYSGTAGLTIKVPGTSQTYINVTNFQADNGCKVVGTPVDGGNNMIIAEAADFTNTTAMAAINTFEEIYEDYPVSLSGTKWIQVGNQAAFFEVATSASDNDHWYIMQQSRLGLSPMYDNGANQRLKRAAAGFTPNNKQVSGNEKYLVRFFQHKSGAGYVIQFATGRYATENITTEISAHRGWYTIYKISDTDGHIGWNKTTNGTNLSSAPMDNDGAGNGLAFWSADGNPCAAAKDGNNDWSIYPVTLQDDVPVAALQALINESSTYAANAGKPGYGTEAWVNSLNEARTAAENALSGTSEQINTAYTNLNNIVTNKDIALPASGKFYRFKSKLGHYINASSNGTNFAMATLDNNSYDHASVFYLTPENRFLNFKSGTYLKDTHTQGNVGEVGNVITFLPSESGNFGYLTLKSDYSGSKYLYDHHDNTKTVAGEGGSQSVPDPILNRNGGYAAGRCEWTAEEVEYLPVPMNADAGYATLYSPVQLSLTGRVEAYVVSEVTPTSVKLQSLENIPAEVGVILKIKNTGDIARGCVFLQVTGGDAAPESKLSGTLASEKIREDAYVLAKAGDKVGLYKAQKNQDSDSKWINNGFKAYLPANLVTGGVSGTGEARVLTFDFDDNAETGINAVEIEEAAPANAAIYDLSGRRVQSAKSGLYIINGKKVIK